MKAAFGRGTLRVPPLRGSPSPIKCRPGRAVISKGNRGNRTTTSARSHAIKNRRPDLSTGGTACWERKPVATPASAGSRHQTIPTEANQTRQDQRRAVFCGLDIGRYQLMSRVTSHDLDARPNPPSRSLSPVHHRQAQPPPLAAAEPHPPPLALGSGQSKVKGKGKEKYHTRLPAEPGVFVAYRPRNRATARFPTHAENSRLHVTYLLYLGSA